MKALKKCFLVLIGIILFVIVIFLFCGNETNDSKDNNETIKINANCIYHRCDKEVFNSYDLNKDNLYLVCFTLKDKPISFESKNFNIISNNLSEEEKNIIINKIDDEDKDKVKDYTYLLLESNNNIDGLRNENIKYNNKNEIYIDVYIEV